jgi:hypothetical protein
VSTEDGKRNAERTGRSVANPNRVQVEENPKRLSADPYDQDREHEGAEHEAAEDADSPAS